MFSLNIPLLLSLACSDKPENTVTKNDTASQTDTSIQVQPSNEPDDPPDSGEEPIPQTLLTIDIDTETGTDASALIDVEVPEGVTSMQLDISSSRFIQLQYIVDPSGQIVFDYFDWTMTDERLLNAATPFSTTVSIPWPARMSEAPIEPGLWTYVVSTLDYGDIPEPNKLISGRLTLKKDDDFSAGTVRILAGRPTGTSDNPAHDAAITAVLNHLKTTYAEWGITLSIREEEVAIVSDLPIISPTSSTLVSAISYSEDTEIFLLFGNSNGVDDQSAYLAYAPCPLIQAFSSVITMSWETASGGDGQLTPAELELWKEEVVQALGHYMGLRHVIDSTGYTLDALSDTPACADLTECEMLAGDNVMYPYPVCTSEGCTARTQLSPQQIEQLHLFVGAD